MAALFGTSGIDFDPEEDIPDLEEKVILVTGGNSGLGAESIKQLAKHNPTTIYLAARNPSSGDALRSSILECHPSVNIVLLTLDLSSLASVKQGAASFLAQSERLDILLLNAGVAFCPPSTTKEGYEIQFGTNHIGHALLTQLLLPTMLHTASQHHITPRIVIVASNGHKFCLGGLGLPDAATGPREMDTTFTRYGRSKLANILFARELAGRYPLILTVAVHPGTVRTPVTRGLSASFPYVFAALYSLVSWMGSSVEEGAKTQLWAATAEIADERSEGGQRVGKVRSGEYYVPVGAPGSLSSYSLDDGVREELWRWTEEELRKHGGGAWA